MKFFATCHPIASVYDIIGDIHGHASTLRHLLDRLGYRQDGGWRHPDGRRAVFVGDIIDRGPEIREAVDLVRQLEADGAAQVVMGNHEYNALSWHTRDDSGVPLRSHNEVHRRQHAATLEAYRDHPAAFAELLDWITGLPLFLETPDLRVVHAAWDETAVDDLRLRPAPCADREFLMRSAVAGNRESEIVEVLLKGVEAPLPSGAVYHDKEGTPRYRTRTRWWIEPQGRSMPLADVAMPPADLELGSLSVDTRLLDHLPGYRDPRPVFVGHYWLTGTPTPLAPRVACLDYSVARGGQLCAYRWTGELPLTASSYICVPAVE